MAEFLLAMSGKLANQIVDAYLRHQAILNTIVVAYGLVLAVAHYNLQRIQRFLLAHYGTEEYEHALDRFARDDDRSVIAEIRDMSRFRFVASPYFFTVHRITRPNLISIIGRKEKIPRSTIARWLALQDTDTSTKE
jgi:hypothetical protein